MSDQPCPCDPSVSYSQCCGRFHSGQRYANTAEELMRSRYSAFVFEDADYLLQTWRADKRPAIIKFRDGQRWTGLEIVDAQRGGLLDAEGTVEFIARYQRQAQAGHSHELSTFERVADQWVYVDGINCEALPTKGSHVRPERPLPH